jgi:hypothetical protein
MVSNDLLHPQPAQKFRIFEGIFDLLSKLSNFQQHNMLCSKRGASLVCLFLKFKYSLLVKRILFLLNAAFATAIFDLISRVHLL